MSEYKPTTEEVRNGFSRSRQMPQFQSPTLQADFDRWLAAHDAEVRREGDYHEGFEEGVKVGRAEVCAGVVAEEPEWEYAYAASVGAGGIEYMDISLSAHLYDDRGMPPLARRRQAGPWIAIEEGS